MAKILFRETECTLSPGESVLDGLLRHGIEVPNACRAGVCQTCLLQAKSGDIPAVAQAGLKDTWKQRGYFMPCMCRLPEGAVLEIQSLDQAEVTTPAEVVWVEELSSKVARVLLRTETEFAYEPGQFVTLIREEDDLRRSYSLASIPEEGLLEMHVQHWPGGLMSSWLHREVTPGEPVLIAGPHGECFYTPGDPARPLLLVGTGTGLAPLWGISRHALRQGHHGPIRIIHRAHSPGELYMHDEISELVQAHENFTYLPSVHTEEGTRDTGIEDIARAELGTLGDPRQVRAYICGNPKIVPVIRRVLFMAGMSLSDIFVDSFAMAPQPGYSELAQSAGRAASSAA